MLRIPVVGSDPPAVPLPVADDHAIPGRVQTVLLAQHRQTIPLPPHKYASPPPWPQPGSEQVKFAPACVPDARRLAHLHPDVGVVPAPLAAGAAVPAPVVPGKGLVHRPVISVNEPMHAGAVVGRAVPGLDEHGRLRLGAAHRVEHQSLYLWSSFLPYSRDSSLKCSVLTSSHFSSVSVFSARSWSCSRTALIFPGTGSPRCAAFSKRLTPSLEI